MKSILLRVSVSLVMCMGVAASTAAQQSAPEDGQKPPAPDAGATAQSDCIAENGGYQRNGKAVNYVIELENKCAKRMKCKVYAYVIGAKGASQGHTTMILAPGSQGAAAKKSYALKVKLVGGLAQTSRECRVF